MGIGKRPDTSDLARTRSGEAFADYIGSHYRTVVEYLSELSFEDGSKRRPSTLTIFFQEGLFKVWLNDKELGRTCCLSGESVCDVLQSLENALATGQADWRGPKPRGRQ